MYFRTVTTVEPDGWAQFGYVRMPEYRWGIFLQPQDEHREVNFGVHKGQAAWQAVRDAYTRRGYLDVKLTAAPKFDDDAKRVTYTAAITEGPQYSMGKLVLSGLSIEGERRIRAAWKIAPGAIFDQSVYQEFLDRGIREAFAGLPFHYEKIGRFLQRDPKTATVDVLLDFQ